MPLLNEDKLTFASARCLTGEWEMWYVWQRLHGGWRAIEDFLLSPHVSRMSLMSIILRCQLSSNANTFPMSITFRHQISLDVDSIGVVASLMLIHTSPNISGHFWAGYSFPDQPSEHFISGRFISGHFVSIHFLSGRSTSGSDISYIRIGHSSFLIFKSSFPIFISSFPSFVSPVPIFASDPLPVCVHSRSRYSPIGFHLRSCSSAFKVFF